jgi:arylsulfatase
MRWPGKIPAGTENKTMFMTIDLLPTIAGRVGVPLPPQPIDGRDVWPIVANQPGAKNPHSSYWFYYAQNELQAVTSGDGEWKLILPHTFRTLGGRPGGKDGIPAKYENIKLTAPELYNLRSDAAETRNVAAGHPEVVERLQAEAEQARAELGDNLTGRKGRGVRPPAAVKPVAGQ